MIDHELLLQVGDALAQAEDQLGVDVLSLVAGRIVLGHFGHQFLVNQLAGGDIAHEIARGLAHGGLFIPQRVNVAHQLLPADFDGIEERLDHFARGLEFGEVAVQFIADAGNMAGHPSHPARVKVKPGRINFVELDFQVGERVGDALTLAAADLSQALERLREKLVGGGGLALLDDAQILDGKPRLFLGFGVIRRHFEELADKLAGLPIQFGVHFFLFDGAGDLLRPQQAEIVFQFPGVRDLRRGFLESGLLLPQ